MLFRAGLNVALATLHTGSQSPVDLVLTWAVAVAVILRYRPRDLAMATRVRLPAAPLPASGRDL